MCLAFRILLCKMNPKYAIKSKFADTEIISYLFHFKQALRCYMISKLDMDKEQVSIAMEKNCLDILAVILKLKIKKKGILYAKNAISQMELTVADSEK